VDRISVIVPLLDEADHVETLVGDLAAQDFAGQVEVIVADGGSTDGSADLLRRAAERAGLDLTVVDNPRRWAGPGLNLCLERATGDLIVRLDSHSRYPPDYLRRCAEVSEETGAWNVGGLFRVDRRTPLERAFACAIDTPFGGHNWTRNRDRRHDADTVFCGAFLPVAFERAGRYDEELAVGEVEDLNVRIRQAGGRVVYDPGITLLYRPRASFTGIFFQYYRYGLWKVRLTVKHRQVLSGRSAVPLLFVGSIAALATAAPASRSARRLLAAGSGVYAAATLAAAVETIERHGESLSLLPRVAALFPTFHFAHGLGGLHGWLREARRALDRGR
jgi:succinoglycan biosynthesis protein ExoA